MPAGSWIPVLQQLWRQHWDVGLRLQYRRSTAEFTNGVIYNDSTVTIATVTDGTSNTMMFGEHGHACTS